jgi:hypothetical protein
LLSQLEQPRVAGTRTNPNDPGRSSWRKRTDALDRQHEWLDRHRTQPIAQHLALFGGDVTDEPQGQVPLLDWAPMDAGDLLRQGRQCFAQRVRKRDRDEEPLRIVFGHAGN